MKSINELKKHLKLITIDRITTLILLGTLFLTWNQSCITDKSIKNQESFNDFQKEFYSTSIRPWVGIEKVNIISIKNVSGKNITQLKFTYKIKNWGNTPAKNLIQKSGCNNQKDYIEEMQYEDGNVKAGLFPGSEREVTTERYATDKDKIYLHLIIEYQDNNGKNYKTHEIQYLNLEKGCLTQENLIIE